MRVCMNWQAAIFIAQKTPAHTHANTGVCQNQHLQDAQPGGSTFLL